MAFEKTQVDPDNLIRKSESIDQELNVLKNTLLKLDGIISRLNAGWEGKAKEEFMKEYAKSKEIFDSMIKEEETINNSLKKCGNDYAQANSTVILEVKSLIGR